MKRFAINIFFMLCLGMLNAQNLTNINNAIASKRYEEAKKTIDIYLSAPQYQKNFELNYLNAKVISLMILSGKDQEYYPPTSMAAFEQYRKVIDLDSNQARLKLTLENYKSISDLYLLSYNAGNRNFNERKYDSALIYFRNTGTIQDFFGNKNWMNTAPDTGLVYFTGLSALYSGKRNEAIGSFKTIESMGMDVHSAYAGIFGFMIDIYIDKYDEIIQLKDEMKQDVRMLGILQDSILHFIRKGLALNPKDEEIQLKHIAFQRMKGDVTGLFNIYEQYLKTNPESYSLNFDYAGDLFEDTHIYEFSKRPKDYVTRCEKIERLYLKALTIEPESYETMLAISRHYYNQMIFAEQDITLMHGNGEDVRAKIEKLNTYISSQLEKCIPHLENIFKHYDPMGRLKKMERTYLKSACELLKYCYDKKNDRTKSEFYAKKMDETDEKHR